MSDNRPQVDAAALLPTFDPFDPEHTWWKYDAFAYAREKCPVVHLNAPSTGPMTMITRYEDVRRVLEDPQTFSSVGGSPSPAPIRLGPLDHDPPEHTEFRRLLNPVFTRQFSLQFEPFMRATAAELIDSFLGEGKVEILSDYAGPYVARILAHMVFDEPDLSKMERAKQVVVRVAEEATEEAFFDLAVLSAEYLAAAIDDPPEKEGVLKALVTGKINGVPVTEDEAMGAIAVIFLGGLDTSRSAIGTICMNIALQPELEERVRNPRWVRNDMDEFIRLTSPVGTFGRTATKDTEIAGCPIKKDERLLIRFDSANRDEAKFPNPDQLQFDPPRAGTAGFGLGIHRCIGMHLARVQIAIAMEELFARVTNLRLDADPSDLRWAPGIANYPDRVPLTFDKI